MNGSQDAHSVLLDSFRKKFPMMHDAYVRNHYEDEMSKKGVASQMPAV